MSDRVRKQTAPLHQRGRRCMIASLSAPACDHPYLGGLSDSRCTQGVLPVPDGENCAGTPKLLFYGTCHTMLIRSFSAELSAPVGSARSIHASRYARIG